MFMRRAGSTRVSCETLYSIHYGAGRHLDAGLLRHGLERRVGQQVAHRFGNWAVAVLQFLFGTVARRRAGRTGDLPVRRKR